MEHDNGMDTTVCSRSRSDEALVDYPRTDTREIFRRPDIQIRRERLASVIADEIVARLLTAHKVDRANKPSVRSFGADEIAEFGALAMSADHTRAATYFEKLRARGHDLDTLFVHLLAPTARHLGELWDQDRCDFIDVTIGVARLQELLAIFGSTATIPIVDHHHRALLITRPDEKHMFGVDMVAKLMGGAGWDVSLGKGLSLAANIATVHKAWFGVVGVTLSATAGVEDVGRTITAIRRASRNRKIGVMVGGPAFLGRPGLAIQVGADAVADDAPAAVVLAKKLLLAQFVKN